MIRGRHHFWVAVVSMVAMSGCAVVPLPFDADEYSELLRTDREDWLAQVEPLSAAMCMDEAIARALKYNLDHRVLLLEQAQASAVLEAGRFDMLPRLMTNAGYHWRNNDNIRNSIDSIDRTPSLANPSISSDRERATADLTLSWSILDFGLGYYNARQNADRILVANERRRRSMHSLVQEVTTTYWRALAAQQLEADVLRVIAEAQQALADSEQILEARLRDPAETLRYQRNLLENLRLLENIERELASARVELARLIGLPAGTPITLVEPPRREFPSIDRDIEALEVIALSNNADLREQSYNARIAAQETRKTLLRMVPGLSFNYGQNYDNDSYLINQRWQQASLNASYNLFNLLAMPTHRRASEYELKVAEARRMAVQVAVVSQLHLAKYQYYDAVRQYTLAEAIYSVDTRLGELARGQERARTGSPLERISAEVTRILSSARLYQALGRVNEASGQIQITLGLEPEIGSVDDLSLDALREEIMRGYQDAEWSFGRRWQCGTESPVSATGVAMAAGAEESAGLGVGAPAVDGGGDLEAAVEKAVLAWAEAWSQQDIDRYFGAYSPQFQPSPGLTRAQWVTQRRSRLAEPRFIEVQIRDLSVTASRPNANATFLQEYRSDRYISRVLKQLDLIYDGNWKVSGERVLGQR
jgi:outer membrane protein TolC